ncbi:MAG: lipopolysaccharide heptosyltransferase II [Thermodesulfovibrionales bacterium]|nr:lipopolysaccharide heptosyltransferase II [Thermodesulfovibrionales bacterium]
MSEKILIRQVNWLGDAVMTMPAIRALRLANPDAHITLLAKPWVSAIFEKDPNIDEIIPYEDRHEGFFGKFTLAREIRHNGFDTAVLLQNAFDSGLMAYLAKIPRRIGFDRDYRGWTLTERVPFDGEDRKLHHVDYYLELLRKSGTRAERTEPWIYLDISERLAAREALSALNRPIIGINPGASFGSAKMWLPDRFAAIAEHAVEDLGGSAVIFGGPGEVSIEKEIFGCLSPEVKGKTLQMAGNTTLRELCALISECDAIISNDSGPMHVAYAVRTPLVSIFGSTSPELTGPPVSPDNSVLRPELPCTPCFKRKCPDKDLKCMEAISSDDAIKAIESVLPSKRAVFFDRDGTLCEDAHYLNSMANLKVFDDINSLNMLSDKQFILIGISNQSGIARGIVDEGFVTDLHTMFRDKHGFKGFYHCPHLPNEGCPCRKPEPGMIYQARSELGINLRRSFVVGDKDSDMLLAKAVGATSILVRTGKQQHSEYASHTVKGLREAVELILSEDVL